MRSFLRIFPGLVMALTLWTHTAQAEPGWVTVFVKRGFVGHYEAKWIGGVETPIRTRIPIMTEGERVRVWLRSSHKEATTLGQLSLAKGADRNGTIVPPAYPVSFKGQASLHVEPKIEPIVSDEAQMPITPGIWYLQQTYQSPQFLYAYDADGFWSLRTGESHDTVQPNKHRTSYTGNVTRIDVFTEKRPPVVLCYGASVTQGDGTTPNSAARYPERLGQLLGHPVLNYGVNGDQISRSRGAPKQILALDGVTRVILVMGHNDLMTQKITDLKDYQQAVGHFVRPLQKAGVEVFLGTLTPGKGFSRYNAVEHAEALRQEINDWIRSQPAGITKVIDFDKAVRDPNSPERLREDFHKDWLHLNDAGYSAMADEAAEVLRATPPSASR